MRVLCRRSSAGSHSRTGWCSGSWVHRRRTVEEMYVPHSVTYRVCLFTTRPKRHLRSTDQKCCDNAARYLMLLSSKKLPLTAQQQGQESRVTGERGWRWTCDQCPTDRGRFRGLHIRNPAAAARSVVNQIGRQDLGRTASTLHMISEMQNTMHERNMFLGGLRLVVSQILKHHIQLKQSGFCHRQNQVWDCTSVFCGSRQGPADGGSILVNHPDEGI